MCGNPLDRQVEADDEPLRVDRVECPEPVAAMVASCWERLSIERRRDPQGKGIGAAGGGSSRGLYSSGEQFLDLVKQV